MLPEGYTAVVARGEHWRGEVTTEPYETAWAKEAIFFLRALKIEGDVQGIMAKVQISADGLHWADEGSTVELPAAVDRVTFVRLKHFGGFLRLSVSVPNGSSVQIVASLNLKA